MNTVWRGTNEKTSHFISSTMERKRKHLAAKTGLRRPPLRVVKRLLKPLAKENSTGDDEELPVTKSKLESAELSDTGSLSSNTVFSARSSASSMSDVQSVKPKADHPVSVTSSAQCQPCKHKIHSAQQEDWSGKEAASMGLKWSTAGHRIHAEPARKNKHPALSAGVQRNCSPWAAVVWRSCSPWWVATKKYALKFWELLFYNEINLIIKNVALMVSFNSLLLAHK